MCIKLNKGAGVPVNFAECMSDTIAIRAHIMSVLENVQEVTFDYEIMENNVMCTTDVTITLVDSINECTNMTALVNVLTDDELTSVTMYSFTIDVSQVKHQTKRNLVRRMLPALQTIKY